MNAFRQMWLPTEEERAAQLRADWAEAVVRRELKLALRRAGIPFCPDDSTVTLGILQELSHLGHLKGIKWLGSPFSSEPSYLLMSMSLAKI